MQQNKIKVAIINKGYQVQSWQYLMLQQITGSMAAEIVLLIFSNTTNNPKSKTSSDAFLLKYYTILENNFTRQKSAFSNADASLLLKDIPFLNILPVRDVDQQQLVMDDIMKIKAYRPDVIINLTGLPFKGEILKITTHGLWAYDPPCDFSNPLFSSAITNNEPCFAVTLKKYDLESPNGAVLCESFSAKNISISKSINWQYWKAASFVLRKLKETGDVRNCHKYYENKPALSIFTGSITLFLAKRFISLVKKKLFSRSRAEQWILYFNPENKNLLNFDVANYHKIQPPADRFWADPCVFSTDNRNHYIFFEEYIYAKKKAHISVLHLDENNKVHDAVKVLEKDYHLSYPFVFKDRDSHIYMIPESSTNKSIELYRCVTFPGEWEFVMNLVEDVHAVDTTIYFTGDTYWMFTGVRANQGASDWDELCIYYSNILLTNKWQAHPCNPVVSDVRNARPAGNIFSQDGKLYRPSQDCSRTYGYAININEITNLSVHEYLEKKVGFMEPWIKDIAAVHSYFTCGNVSVIDARIKRS